MSDETSSEYQSRGNAFAKEAEQAPTGLLREFLYFLRHNKKWWLIPIILVLLFVGILVVIDSSAAAPFIYTLF